MKIISWNEALKKIIQGGFDCFIEFDEKERDSNLWTCCECGEPIYEHDYPEIELDDDDNVICPVCENSLE